MLPYLQMIDSSYSLLSLTPADLFWWLVWQSIPLLIYFYLPQTKFAKFMFLHLSVSHSVHRGVCLSACWDIHPHLPGTDIPPEADTPPRSRHPPQSRHPPAEIRATSRRYASYWNAYFFKWKWDLNTCTLCVADWRFNRLDCRGILCNFHYILLPQSIR